MTTKKKIFIVAGNATEFKSYVDKKLVEWTEYGGTDKGYFPEYVYVTNAWQLKGLNEIEGYYTGSYMERDDLDEVEWCILAIKGRNAIADVQKGSNGISGSVNAVNTTAIGTMLPIGSGGIGTISNINTTVSTQYSYPNPNLEQRTKALEEALEWIKKQIDSAAS